MWGFINAFPDEWFVPATVIRGGGRDRFGVPQPTTEIERPAVLIGPRSTVEADGPSMLIESEPSLYDQDPTFRYEATDRIKVAAGYRNAGTWAVAGLPKEWPYGNEVPLERA